MDISSKVSVIIPVFNEERFIEQCLTSLLAQSFKNLEIIVVDDGSVDRTVEVVRKFPARLLTEDHKGAGMARNLGAKEATGEILVFVDADMTFTPTFIEELTQPIREGKAVGTFSKEEFVGNTENVWARCWSLNKGASFDRMHPSYYPNEQEVFRAITKEAFLSVGGFDDIGYTDDWTVARKLGVKAQAVTGAQFYHYNPSFILEVFSQARWFGKNEFLTKNFGRKIYNLVRYFFVFSIVKGVIGVLKFKEVGFLPFKIVYDFGVWLSVLLSFFGEKKYKPK